MTNCNWIDSKLEALLTDNLSSEELAVCRTHLASCEECRRQVESFNSVDSLVRRVFLHRTALATRAARMNTRPRAWRVAFTLAGLTTAAAMVLGIGWTFLQQPQTPAPPVVVQVPPPPSLEVEVKKDNDQTTPERKLTKPDQGEQTRASGAGGLETGIENGLEFAITDQAGYTVSLEFYRGKALLFAVVSPGQKTAIAGLQQVYETYGANPGIRILGVASRRDDRFEGVTFPLYFNHGSQLLGIKEGNFLLLDKSGKKQLEGSFADPQDLAQIKRQLGQLGIR